MARRAGLERLGRPAEPDPIADKVARMAAVGFSTAPSFSPDGASIAFLSSLTGVPQIFIVPAEGGWPVQVTAGSDPVGQLAWSPKGDLIAYSLAPGGGLNTQVHVVAPDGSRVRRLTAGGKDNNSFGAWTDDGSALTVSSNERDAASFDAYLVDVKSGRKTLVAKIGGVGGLGELSRDGRRSVLSKTRNRGDNDLFLVEVAAKTEVLLTRHTPPAQASGRIVLHGANDTNVPVIEAEQTVAALKQRGLPVEYVLFPDEGHGWRKTANRVASTVAITKFFVKYLK